MQTVGSFLTSARAAWVLIAGFGGVLWWSYAVADTASDAKLIAQAASSKADVALTQNAKQRVEMARLNGKLDVTNTKLDALNRNIERILRSDK